MRIHLVALTFALTACGGVVVDDSSGTGGGLGGTGTPSGGRETPSGGSDGSSGGTPGGASASGGACFTATDPAFVTPRAPTMTTSQACVATGARRNTFASEDEVLSLVVGSWMRCGPSTSWFLSHPGFVIGGDRTFRFLEDDGGTLRETAVLGRVKVTALGAGQYQVDVERSGEGFNYLHFTQVGVGDRLDVVETGGSATIARMAPGVAATPTSYVDAGACSLEGTWDAQAGVGEHYEKSDGTFAFDGRGHFVGGALGSEVCSAPTMNGTYRLVGDVFEIVTSAGMGCPTNWAAGWKVAFSADCRRATLTTQYDNCTGLRHSIEYDTVLTKKSP